MNDKRQFSNTSKRLPIVFCLDISPSMSWVIYNNSSAIELLNTAVAQFFRDIQEDTKARSCAEVAFVTFSTEVEIMNPKNPFSTLNRMNVPVFEAVEEGGTNMAEAILTSISLIQEERKKLREMEIPCYAPFLVLVTDGNPDANDNAALQQKALDAVRRFCSADVKADEVIIPFIIGVGDHIDPDTLKAYAKGFTDCYFPIKGTAANVKTKFNKVFKLVSNSASVSRSMNGRKASDVISTIQSDMADLLVDLRGE